MSPSHGTQGEKLLKSKRWYMMSSLFWWKSCFLELYSSCRLASLIFFPLVDIMVFWSNFWLASHWWCLMVSAILSAANSEPRSWENRSAMMVSMASRLCLKSFPQRFISCLLNAILLRFSACFLKGMWWGCNVVCCAYPVVTWLLC